MSRTGPRSRLGPTWSYGLAGGLATIPFTVLSDWQAGDEMTFGPVFLVSVAVGYLAKQRGLRASAVGTRVGLVAGVPTVWLLVELVGASGSATGFEMTGTAATVLVGAVFLAIVWGLVVVSGALGSRLGGWLAERTGATRRPPAGH